MKSQQAKYVLAYTIKDFYGKLFQNSTMIMW